MVKIQTIYNVRGTNQNFETLEDKIQTTPNFEIVNCILVELILQPTDMYISIYTKFN